MTRLWLLLVFLVAAPAAGEVIKETRPGKSIEFYLDKGSGVEKVCEINESNGALRVDSIEDLGGAGPVDFLQGLKTDTVESRDGVSPVDFPQALKSDTVSSRNGTDPVVLPQGLKSDTISSQNGTDPVTLNSSLKIQDGSEGTAGHVLKSSDTNGSAQWQPPSVECISTSINPANDPDISSGTYMEMQKCGRQVVLTWETIWFSSSSSRVTIEGVIPVDYRPANLHRQLFDVDMSAWIKTDGDMVFDVPSGSTDSSAIGSSTVWLTP